MVFNPLSWPYTGTAKLSLLLDWGGAGLHR
jgi:hypothetical protein